MSQTPNPRAYDMWNQRPTFMHGVRYTANQWEDIHAWINTALTNEREHAVQDCRTGREAGEVTATESYYLRRIADLEQQLANAKDDAPWPVVVVSLGPYPVWPWRQRLIDKTLNAIRGNK